MDHFPYTIGAFVLGVILLAVILWAVGIIPQ